MAAYFIDYISSYSNTNNKGRELQQFISRFKQLLIKDDLSLDALKADIERETERLNKAYPRTKPFVLDFHSTGTSGQCYARVDGNDDKVVFYLTWLKVLGTYQFNENSLSNKKESENSCPATHLSRT